MFKTATSERPVFHSGRRCIFAQGLFKTETRVFQVCMLKFRAHFENHTTRKTLALNLGSPLFFAARFLGCRGGQKVVH